MAGNSSAVRTVKASGPESELGPVPVVPDELLLVVLVEVEVVPLLLVEGDCRSRDTTVGLPALTTTFDCTALMYPGALACTE
jgi:hypothetical protein